jgi:hypothetical protein
MPAVKRTRPIQNFFALFQIPFPDKRSVGSVVCNMRRILPNVGQHPKTSVLPLNASCTERFEHFSHAPRFFAHSPKLIDNPKFHSVLSLLFKRMFKRECRFSPTCSFRICGLFGIFKKLNAKNLSAVAANPHFRRNIEHYAAAVLRNHSRAVHAVNVFASAFRAASFI